MILYSDTGELVLEDGAAGDPAGSWVVIVDVETGAERGRAPTGAPFLGGMFFCPGFGRDLYAASASGAISRIYVV